MRAVDAVGALPYHNPVITPTAASGRFDPTPWQAQRLLQRDGDRQQQAGAIGLLTRYPHPRCVKCGDYQISGLTESKLSQIVRTGPLRGVHDCRCPNRGSRQQGKGDRKAALFYFPCTLGNATSPIGAGPSSPMRIANFAALARMRPAECIVAICSKKGVASDRATRALRPRAISAESVGRFFGPSAMRTRRSIAAKRRLVDVAAPVARSLMLFTATSRIA